MNSQIWNLAHRQAKQIALIRDRAAKRHQESLLLATLVRAMKGGV